MSIRIRVGAIVIDDNKLLLVNHQKGSHSYWLLPGGGVEQKETLTQALIRELKEELELTIKPQELLFTCESISPGGRHVLHHYFKAQIKKGLLRVNPDHRLKGAAWMSKEQLKQQTVYPDIKELLIKLLETGKLEGPLYLGNLWH